MLIVKPHGRTATQFSTDGRLTRTLRTYLDPEIPLDIVSFTLEHDKVVISQWISMIDKIIAKPKGNLRPSELQWGVRDKLGAAAFRLIQREHRLRSREDDWDKLKRIWNRKLHPYGRKVQQARDPARAKRELRGRWYRRFAGDADPTKLDFEVLAAKIHSDLYDSELRISEKSGAKRHGRIQARAASIATAFPGAPNVAALNPPLWADAEWQRYSTPDIAAEIKRAALDAERSRRPVGRRMVAPLLHAHYARLFPAAAGGALPIRVADDEQPALLALHSEVRAAYRELLTGHKKSPARILPSNKSELRWLLLEKRRSKRLAALVRLGKVIHYAASAGEPYDNPESAVDHWPLDITASRFWTSAGQSEIKRNEAFVRIWRGTLSAAAGTATDWGDPSARERDDILSAFVIKAVTGAAFDDGAFQRKARVLFGRNATLLIGSSAVDREEVLRFALQGLASLRNNAFHFKGRGGFTRALAKAHPEPRGAVAALIGQLWQRDVHARAARLKEEMRGLHCERFLDQSELSDIYTAIVAGSPDHAPMPRFRRVLHRVDSAWRSGRCRLHLPAVPNRADLQNPIRLCQYGTLKLLYERAFPAWLGVRTTEWLNGLVARAVERATAAAQLINRQEDAVSRAAGKFQLKELETIDDLFDRLSAATATEFRVQRGYDPAPENARRQARYIDDLRCDVVGQAFEAWLEEAGFDFLLDADPDVEPPTANSSDLEAVPAPEVDSGAEPWALRLYFLLHLVPPDDAAKLLHQIRKWRVLEGASPRDTVTVERILSVYLDMNDANSEGDMGGAWAEPLRVLFERPADFDGIFAAEAMSGEYIPLRGLREMMRFGNLTYMMPALRRSPVRTSQISDLCWSEAENGAEAPIVSAQRLREALHSRWVEERGLRPADRLSYARQLDPVVWHRHLAAQVRLTNHVRAHQLLVRVLGRLVDFAGLWERDLYFASLALVRLFGGTPSEAFGKLDHLRNGRIIAAVRSLRTDGIGAEVRRELVELFGDIFASTNPKIGTRNRLAHFQATRGPEAINLTELINETRALMDHDRKLRNAVSKSVIEMLEREGLVLSWTCAKHVLSTAQVKTRQAQHLGGAGPRENLHGQEFVDIIAALFGGAAIPIEDVTTAPLPASKAEEASRRFISRPAEARGGRNYW